VIEGSGATGCSTRTGPAPNDGWRSGPPMNFDKAMLTVTVLSGDGAWPDPAFVQQPLDDCPWGQVIVLLMMRDPDARE
jgi:hypothetical protein